MQITKILFFFGLNMALLSCESHGQPLVRVVPELMISQKDHHIAIVVRLTNPTDNNYIMNEGYCFMACMKVLKKSHHGTWEEIESPGVKQREEQFKSDLESDSFSTWKDHYESDTPLFREWVLADTSNVLDDLDHRELTLKNEVAKTTEWKQLWNCLPYSPHLFFVEAKATYERFENLDYILDNPGHYRVAFFPRNIKHQCTFAYKGFQLVSSDIVQFDSVDIWIK